MQVSPEVRASSSTEAIPAPPSHQVKPLWRSVLEVGLAIAIVALLVNVLVAIVDIKGSSMNPTLRQGQHVLVSRLPYRLAAPQRGDIVVIRNRIDPSAWDVQRVVGVPGDVLSIKGAQVTVDGQPLSEPYLPESLERVGVNPLTTGQYRLDEDEYFLLNDNRADINDSRSYGVVPSNQLIGRAWLVVWPLETIAAIRHERLEAPPALQ